VRPVASVARQDHRHHVGGEHRRDGGKEHIGRGARRLDARRWREGQAAVRFHDQVPIGGSQEDASRLEAIA
jgi:hypothetical protein